MLAFSQFAVAQSFSGGNGTENDPYKISTAADLQELSKSVAEDMNSYAEKFFVMTQDIDMAGVTEFDPIGNNFSGDVHPFSGTFDGQGYKIFNLEKSWDDLGFVGLFGVIMNATIKNLTLSSSNIYGDLSVGGIVGVCMMDNEISNCHTTADVTVGVRKFYVAGICGGTLISGSNGSVIKDCTNAARVIGCVGYTAGILGTNGQKDTKVIRCGNTGEISDDQLHVAGVVAHSKNGISIVDCYNTGKISLLALEGADNARGAGILAIADEVPAEENINVTNCYNVGEFNEVNEKIHAIYQGDYMSYDNTFVTNCYYAGDVIPGEFDYTVALKLDEMKTQDFVTMLNNGRTDDACWTIEEGKNNGFPVPTNNNGVATSVNTIEGTNAEIVYVSGIVNVSNVSAGAVVNVVDITGRVIYSVSADAEGNAKISTEILPSGAYIVTVEGLTVKIAK